MQILNIFNDKDLVGTIKALNNSNDFIFSYSQSWIDSGFALSPALPLTNNLNQTKAKNFIENLLPEGDGLDEIVSHFNISKNNKFGLIKVIGKETTGSLIFSNQNELNAIQSSFREISIDELSKRIKDRKNRPLSIWDNKPRLSIAGVQEKLILSIIDGKFGLAEGNLASTHILKFSKNNNNIVLNEFLSLKLAQLAGIKIPNIELLKFDDEFVLKVERFDRKIISKDEIKRLHIIDMCQVEGLPVSFKYERPYGNNESTKDLRMGINFKKVFNTISFCKIPILEKNKIIDWTIVNLCLGNCDSHGKNISFFVNNDSSLELTPFYDIVNISLYSEYSQELAMAFDDEFNLNNLKAYDFIEFCNENNIKEKTFVDKFNKISNIILKELSNPKLKQIIIPENKNNSIFFDNYSNNCKKRIENLSLNINLINSLKKDPQAIITLIQKAKHP